VKVLQAAVLVCVVLFLSSVVSAQEALRAQVASIAQQAQGKVSAACALAGTPLNCDLNADSHPPMQSVFKFPVVLTALHQIEQGKLTLDQQVRFLPGDRILPGTHSGLQDKYPQGNVDVPLQELMHRAIVDSDNVAVDIIVRVIGTSAVNDYIASLGVQGFHCDGGEQELGSDPKAQYRSYFAPSGAVTLLLRVANNSPLNAEHTALLLDWMSHLANGETRIPGALPAGTVVAHKTGSSGTHDGVTAATNDIGLITLPDGRKLAVAVFVTDARADSATRDKVIAQIAAAAYASAVATSK
jgi:beta-lactamase class A